ncbi:unnamed protein product [Rotaria socialis]|uniref:Uncharacterized protein n=3 Tax=Rotaria socialis TaxID=392032 RepID=A0A818F0H5_9BILA|nr:unnamed protein product [Rotaria socialis]CAF3468293.1 unnamed protein product [Rotaria socialis]CAF4479569.1 unnamed protein product [Rotaria socialis]
MYSYGMKTTIENDFDKFIKELTSDESVDEENKDIGISVEDVLAHQKKQKALEKERKLRQAKVQKQREEARQKIRDKYNIKKTDDLSTPAHSDATTSLDENNARAAQQVSNVENQDATHQPIDEYSRIEQISGEVAAANSRIVADTQGDQAILVTDANTRSAAIEEKHKLKIKQFAEEFDVVKA